MAHRTPFEVNLPWVKSPLIVNAPMRLIAYAPLAVPVTLAGGLGFIGAGTEVSDLHKHLEHSAKLLVEGGFKIDDGEASGATKLSVGVGVICHGTSPRELLGQLHTYLPTAIWLFAPSKTPELAAWSIELRKTIPGVQIWLQVGSVGQAVESCNACPPDVLVVQGSDGGGHGLTQGAGLIPLLPEVAAAVEELDLPHRPALVAAGGIMNGAGAAAALMLHPTVVGVCLGTRYLASPQANVSNGYRNELLRASDGGQITVRSRVYDTLRGVSWPPDYGGRGIINASYEDWVGNKMTEDENKAMYQEEVAKGDAGWGPKGRMTTYAGTGVGLIRALHDAGDITEEVRREALETLKASASRFVAS